MTDSSITAVAAASDFRLRGNHEFSNGSYDHAVSLYTAALEELTNNDRSNSDDDEEEEEEDEVREERVLNLCNRSACYWQQEEWELSCLDARQAWDLSEHRSVKAAFRLAKTCLALNDYEAAKETIQAGLRVLQEQELSPIPADVAEKSKPAIPDRRQIEEQEDDDDSKSLSKIQQDERERQHSNIKQHLPPPDVSQQRRSLQDLWKQVLEAAYEGDEAKATKQQPETSIKYARRPVSVKEFQLQDDLGHGNFSEIVTVRHKVTGERFALKRIAKKQAADLAKRQHPNVYNEIQMERRVLLERLASPGHPFIVRMYHAFQDYNNLYYLMDLHAEARGDVWSQLRYKNLPGYGPTQAANSGEALVMMGCHRSTAQLWLYELVSALEYMHFKGVVHRDLKPENLLLDDKGHLIVIDFGTAKDLVQTDLNGPEFVGTPDFMSPEQVEGKENGNKDGLVATTTTDLWALGAICFQLQTGHTPYWCPSPYLAFLKIKRALQTHNLRRPEGIIDDECWDFICQLMRGKPEERLGANTFVAVDDAMSSKGSKRRRMERKRAEGYDVIRKHPYFAPIHNEFQHNPEGKGKLVRRSKAVPIPTLSDLCIRGVAEMAYRDSLDVELCDLHPPGDGSRHDLLRLKPRERAAVRHCLDRRRLLSDPRLHARFFADTPSARLDKVRPRTHSFVGLEQMNDDQGKPPKAQMHDQYAIPIEMGPIQIVHLTNPLFAPTTGSNGALDEATRKTWTKLLKKCVANVNRTRPKMVVVTGQQVDAPARKILARISETIPVVVHDGSTFFTFWMSGVQCIALQASAFSGATGEGDAQMHWLREQLEQVRMSKHPLYVFVDADPRTLPQRVVKRLARGRTLLLCGLLSLDDEQSSASWVSTIAYKANEMVQERDDEEDAVSICSNESEEDDERDSFTMKVCATSANGLRWITVEEEPDMWSTEFKAIELPPPSADNSS